MNSFECNSCKCDKFYLEEKIDSNRKNKRVGLYCAHCNKWSKWVGANEFSNLIKVAQSYKMPEIKPLSEPMKEDNKIYYPPKDASLIELIGSMNNCLIELQERVNVATKEQNKILNNPPWGE